jgi:hypothetical protein
MAGIFGDIAEFFTGDKQRKADKAAAQQQQEVRRQQEQASKLGEQYMQGAGQSMGANAAEYMQKANQAAQGQAAQEAQMTTQQATRNALQAARTAGVNKGQAAMLGSQQAGQTYNQALQSGLQSGRQQYQSAAQQFAGIGQNQQSLAQGSAGQALQGAQAQQQAAAGGAATTGQMLGGIAQGAINVVPQIAAAFSDRHLKTDIKPSSGGLEELLAKVRPVDFRYTPESGEDPTKARKGVLAQDLEKTSMADNVIDTPEGKMVDTAQQTLSNTNLIAQMAEELYDLKAQLKALKGGK